MERVPVNLQATSRPSAGTLARAFAPLLFALSGNGGMAVMSDWQNRYLLGICQTPRPEEAVAKGYAAERDGFSRPDNSSTYKIELSRFVPFATASERRGGIAQQDEKSVVGEQAVFLGDDDSHAIDRCG
jgi:hypothetical protein